MDCNLLGSSVHGILQESILEWSAMPSSRGSSQPRNPTHISLAGGFFITSTTWKAIKIMTRDEFYMEWQDSHSYDITATAAAKSLQSCLTLCNPRDGRPPGSPVPGTLQARTLEWVAISFSSAWKWKWSPSVVSDSLWPHGLQPTRLLRPWDFPGKSTGVGCHCLLWWRLVESSI